MKKSLIIVLGVAIILFGAYCFREQPEKYLLLESGEKNIDSGIQNNKQREYISYLEKTVEKNFAGEDDVKSADAKVSYKEAGNEYTIKLSLIADKEISAEEIKLYENSLKKTYAEVTLIVNDEDIYVYEETDLNEDMEAGERENNGATYMLIEASD